MTLYTPLLQEVAEFIQSVLKDVKGGEARDEIRVLGGNDVKPSCPRQLAQMLDPTLLDDEEQINGGQGILVKQKTLYHGSGTLGTTEMKVAQEGTLGEGAYFTSQRNRADEYAHRRAYRRGKAVVYETAIKDLTFLDLRRQENLGPVLDGFVPIIQDIRKAAATWVVEVVCDRVLELINSGQAHVGALREVTWSFTASFSKYVGSMGYDGLVALEGGEPPEVGPHDSYVVFRPETLKLRELELQSLPTDKCYVGKEVGGFLIRRRREQPYIPSCPRRHCSQYAVSI